MFDSAEWKLLDLADDWCASRYLSGRHAAECYVQMRVRMQGCPAIDYERPMVQCHAAPENPHMERATECRELERAFAAAARRLSGRRYQVWWLIRIGELNRPEGFTYRELARACDVDSKTIQRWVIGVDRKVEDVLAEMDLLVRAKPRLHKEVMK